MNSMRTCGHSCYLHLDMDNVVRILPKLSRTLCVADGILDRRVANCNTVERCWSMSAASSRCRDRDSYQ
jgi:hypothetical protein